MDQREVDEPMDLREDQIRRYARHVLLPDVGGTGQKRLLAARVAARDLSASNAVAVVYLAAAGVGTLISDDRSPVTEADVAAGGLYEASDVGRPRVEAAAERVAALNPDVRVVGEGESRWSLACGASSGLDAIDALERGAVTAVRLIREIARRGE